MATKGKTPARTAKANAGPKTKKIRYAGIHKLAAAVSLIAFSVVIVAGMMAGAGIVSITFRAVAAVLVVGVVSRVLIRIWATYEEMNRGQA